MLIVPKINPKKRYWHKLDYQGATKGHSKLFKGQFGLQAKEGHWITNRQIEATRKVLSRHVKNYGKVIINIYPFMPKTKKPIETRMGCGKGSIETWVAVVRKGTIMFEIFLNDLKYSHLAEKSLREAAYKLPISCKTVYQEGLKESLKK